jgi:hypothetical protein
MRNLLASILLVMLSASPAAALSDADVERFVSSADGMGRTTAMLRACGFEGKAKAFHGMVMEQMISLLATHADKVPVLEKNYDGGIKNFKAINKGRTPPGDTCQKLLDAVSN